MQIALKSMEKFATCDINTLAEETTRLQLAGIKSKFQECCSTNVVDSVKNDNPTMPSTMMDAIADKVIEKLKNTTISSQAGGCES